MFNPAHPGELLREFLPAALSVTEAARKLEISRVQLSRLLNGRSAISADMAIRISKLTRTTPESWLANQMQWDLWQARRKPRAVTHPKMTTTELRTAMTASRSIAGSSARRKARTLVPRDVRENSTGPSR
ncbi:MAG: HigA family addiction module antitoxin [Gammaproteobacteria bacterium]